MKEEKTAFFPGYSSLEDREVRSRAGRDKQEKRARI